MTPPLPADAAAPAVAALSADDAPACAALSQAAGWPHTVQDWRVRLAHGRGFALRQGGEIVCACVVLAYPGRAAFLGMLLTAPAQRGRGLGARLVRACLDRAAEDDLPLALISVPAATGLYRRLGFVEAGGAGLDSLRGEAAGPASASAASLRPARPEDLAAIAALDAAAVGYDRSALLADTLERGAALAWLAERHGTPVGFALGLIRGPSAALGPVVAPDEGCGLALLGAQLGRLPRGQPVRVDIPRGRQGLRAGLARHGLAHAATLPLMVSRPVAALPYAEPSRVMAAWSAIAG